MILIISTCKEKLHELEFVKPIEAILKNNKIKFKTINYKNISFKEIEKSEKIIITGTSLADNEFLEIKNIIKLNFIKSYSKPILGICAGMQIIGIINNGNIKKATEIGYYKEKLTNNFLNIKKNTELEVYHLHNNYIDFSILSDFIVYSTSNNVSQAIKHKTKDIYGVLFHPEVRNKEIILEFVKK